MKDRELGLSILSFWTGAVVALQMYIPTFDTWAWAIAGLAMLCILLLLTNETSETLTKVSFYPADTTTIILACFSSSLFTLAAVQPDAAGAYFLGSVAAVAASAALYSITNDEDA